MPHYSSPFCLLDPCCDLYFSVPKHCLKSRKCGKQRFHQGRCNSDRQFNRFWEKSQFLQLRKDQRDVAQDAFVVQLKEASLESRKEELLAKQNEVDTDVEAAEEKLERASML